MFQVRVGSPDILEPSYLETIKGIESAYEKAAAQDFLLFAKETRDFERLVAELPPRAWLE